MTSDTHSPEVQQLLDGFLKYNRDHALICLDCNGTVTAWLGAAEELLGYSSDDAVGHPLGKIFIPEDRRMGLDKHELEVARTDSRAEDDRWHLRKDGTRIWVTGTVSPIRNEAGTLLGFVKVMRDRTDLKAQIESLETQGASLRQSRERVHVFLKTLGHELRNPLAPLSSAVHIIDRVTHEPRVQGALKIITRQLDALMSLADDLMDVARLEEGKVTLCLERVDLRLVLQQAVDGLQNEAAEKGLMLRSVLPAGALEVEIDAPRFQRLVLNLIGNALKYTLEGGSVWVKATLEGGDVLMRVEDTGIGIAPEVLPRIFELFTQEPGAAEVAPQGLGVGLAMVREIAQLHGGSVQARSGGRGKGAEFTVRLPVARAGG
ncbi:MAG: PAS domain-containing sensor histidine kinase [Pseudomonadota bacterium]